MLNARALIGLGSNLGDRKAILDGAVATLREFPGVNLVAVSRYHETRPVGGPSGQGPFLNAAAVLEPNLGPHAMLGVLQEVEARFGRERVVRWGERTLDLDLLLYGRLILGTPDLRLPHPRFAHRRFVLAPAAEVAPELVDPLTERPIADLLASLDRRPSLVCLDLVGLTKLHPTSELLTRVHQLLLERLGAVALRREDISRGRWLPLPPLMAHLARVRSLARRLSTWRTIPDLEDRWLVADFSLEQDLLRGVYHRIAWAAPQRHRSPGTLVLDRFHRMALSAVRNAPGPTLLVLLGQSGKTYDGGLSAPVLIPDAEDPEAIAAEIAAACEATRS